MFNGSRVASFSFMGYFYASTYYLIWSWSLWYYPIGLRMITAGIAERAKSSAENPTSKSILRVLRFPEPMTFSGDSYTVT